MIDNVNKYFLKASFSLRTQPVVNEELKQKLQSNKLEQTLKKLLNKPLFSFSLFIVKYNVIVQRCFFLYFAPYFTPLTAQMAEW